MAATPMTAALDQLRLELMRAPAEVRAAPSHADRQKFSRIFELCMAVELGLIPWASLPPAAFEAAEARTGARLARYAVRGGVPDYGVDAASEDLRRVAQAKWYGENSTITWTDIGKFHSMGVAVGATEMSLVRSEQSRIHSMAASLLGGLPVVDRRLPDVRIDEICAQALGDAAVVPMLSSEELDEFLDELFGDTAAVPDDAVLDDARPDELDALLPHDESPVVVDDTAEEDLSTIENLLEGVTLDDEAPAADAAPERPPLRRWQAEAIPLLLESLSNVKTREEPVHACIACGAGKSRLVIELIAQGKHTPCAILVPAKALLEQFRAEVAKWAPQLSVGLVGDALCELGRDITVATYNSASKIAKRHFALLVVDEAHHMEAEFEAVASEKDSDDSSDDGSGRVFAMVARSLDYERALLISATLDRNETACDYAYLIDAAVRDGAIVDYNIVIPVFTPGDRREALRQMVVDHPEWTRVLAYCNTVAAAAEFAQICAAGGVPAATFDGKTPVRQRLATLEDLAAGQIRVLATVNTLGEGLDRPEADTEIFVEPRNSRINVTQCLGRIQRVCPTTGKTTATVVLPAADEERELARFLRLLGAGDPRLRPAPGSRLNGGRLTIVTASAAVATEEELVAAQKRSESVYDRAGVFLRGDDPRWWEQLEMLHKFVEEHERIPFAREIYRGEQIGSWVCSQRQAQKGQTRGKMTSERKTALEAIPGWFWENDLESTWLANLNRVLAYVEEYSKLPTTKTVYNGDKIGQWISNQRKSRKGSGKGKLTPERIAALETIPGWFWEENTESIWQSNFNALREYVAEHNQIPSVRTKDIGVWVSHQRDQNKKRALTKEHAEALDSIPGWSWGEVRDDPETTWWSNLDKLREYVVVHSKLPSRKVIYDGIHLGSWIDTQLQVHKGQTQGKLTEDRIAALESIPGWVWAERRDLDLIWQTKFDTLRDFVTKKGRIPSLKESYFDGDNIGKWVSHQRQNQKQNKLSRERQDALETIPGWVWGETRELDPDAAWLSNLKILREFVENHRRIPISTEVVNGAKIGQWVSTQRQTHRKGELRKDRVDALEKISGWAWTAREMSPEETWQSNLEKLCEYAIRCGRLPTQSESIDGVHIGTWITGQRQARKKKMSRERQDLLEAIPGWTWGEERGPREQDPETVWQTNLAIVQKFVGQNQKLPLTTAEIDGIKIGSWITNQRTAFRKNKISKTRQETLEAIPQWTWGKNEDLANKIPKPHGNHT